MAERKRKVRDESRHKKGREGNKKRKPSNLKSLTRGKKEQHKKEERRRGPRLPNALCKELDLMKATEHEPSKSDEQIDFNVENNVYEYEEEIPEEESKKNNRFDHVENFEYELPDQFEDENVPSDEEDNDNEEDIDVSGKNEEGENAEEEALRHARMLQEITGLPSDAFQGKKGMNNAIITEAYPESEYNPSRDVLDGEGHISIQDLLVPLREKSGFNKLRKNIDRMKKKSMSIHAPIPKPEQERLERKAAYEHSRKDITKWEPLVKRNREAPTLYFDEDVDLGFSTVGAIASEFKPRTEFEKKIASFVNDNEVVEAHNKDGARLLEMNKISVEDVMERQNHLARMRSLLFRHEMKSKRIKKIKSKTYHRLLKKDKLKAAAQVEMDPEAAKELARKQEFKRAEERMRLRHKNSSKWAKRILERGLNAQDEGTRTALAEQLHQHALLTRKMNTMESSSSDGGSDHDDSDEDSAGSAQDGDLRLLEKAKEKTLEVLEEDDEMPKSGVLALPFMVRGMKKREEAASEEAKLVLQEYEASIIQLEDKGEAGSIKADAASGRRVFGASTKQIEESSDKRKLNHDYPNIDSEDEPDIKKVNMEQNNNHCAQKDVNIDLDILREESEINHDTVFKTFDDIIKDPGCKTTYEVAIFASNSWKKKKNMPGEVTEQMERDNESKVVDTSRQDQDSEELDDSDTDSAGHMVDGILSVGTKSTYKLPSQAELIRRAFAGDDVEGDFEKDKEEVLNEENPEPEKPVLLPGWGQWTDVQKRKGLPSWMLEEHENAKKKREEALKKRKDANLKHVIISEKLDKKAEKLHTKTLPYPYTSKEVFNQSIRMPIGPEFNPVTTIGALNRPEVVKKAGVIIKPIKYEDVNPHERTDNKRGAQKQKSGKTSSKDLKKKKNTKGMND